MWRVTLADHFGHSGEAMAMGERTPLALLDSAAAARMAVAESITNILAADIASLRDIRLSANWMAACGQPGEDAALYDAVRAVGMELCPALGIAIPVGKDSLSMRTAWRDGAGRQGGDGAGVADRVGIRAGGGCAARTDAAAAHWTRARRACCWSIWARAATGWAVPSSRRCMARLGEVPPDLDSPALLAGLAAACVLRVRSDLLLAYHDISDGGLLATLAEMAFASHCGLDVDLPAGSGGLAGRLFAEELGAVVQVRAADVAAVQALFAAEGLDAQVHDIGAPQQELTLEFRCGARAHAASWQTLRRAWSEISHRMRLLRDEPECAREEFAGAAGCRRSGPAGARWPSTPAKTSRRRTSRAARGRGWQCCASRASTARWKWRQCSSWRDSSRMTCT